MWISRLQIESYASFDKPEPLVFSPGINLIIGANNSGKSSVLKSVTTPFEPNPHRSEEAFLPGEVRPSIVNIDIQISSQELAELLAQRSTRLSVPVENPSTAAHAAAEGFFGDTENITFRLTRSNGPTRFREASPFPYLSQSSSTAFIEVSSGELKVHGHPSQWDSLAQLFDANYSNVIFYLKPQRTAPAVHPYGEASILSQNGDNLPVVLTYLQNRRPDAFDEIVYHLDFIVGSVNGITVAPKGEACEVLIWPTDNRTRDELSFDLENSGTGVAQCLTILAAASTEISSTILIDEINSFLHPSAVKRLIYVLRQYYNYHQYIISTHSADVISYAGASTAYHVEKKGYTSSLSVVDLTRLEEARPIYRGLGISMLDLFGADRVMWVEGQTEEICFPILCSEKDRLDGISVKAVPATGDFTAKKRTRKMVIDLYNAVTQSIAPLVSKAVFSFDREDLSAADAKRFEDECNGLLFILPRRNLESFLINGDAITQVVNRYVMDGEISVAAVDYELRSCGDSHEFGAARYWKGRLDDVEWLSHVDGAKLIKHVFSAVTNKKLEFRKTKHSPEILISIAENAPEQLKELSEFVQRIVGALRE